MKERDHLEDLRCGGENNIKRGLKIIIRLLLESIWRRIGISEHGNKNFGFTIRGISWLAGALILPVILCLPIYYNTTIGTLGLVIHCTPATFLCKFRVECSVSVYMYLEIPEECHSASFKNAKTVPFPLSKRNPELFEKNTAIRRWEHSNGLSIFKIVFYVLLWLFPCKIICM
jgi:hypothetical protein